MKAILIFALTIIGALAFEVLAKDQDAAAIVFFFGLVLAGAALWSDKA